MFSIDVADVFEVFVSMQVNVWSLIFAKSRSIYFSYPSWILDSLICMRLIL